MREGRRIIPMAAGIVWGVASVFVLVAVGRGFEATQRGSLEALGDSFVLLRVNRPTLGRGDVRANNFVRLESEDMRAIAAGSPSIAALSPKANSWFIKAFRGGNITRASAAGVEPQYANIVHVPLAPGSRWIDANDIDQELSVGVIGYGVRRELFGDGPYLGEEIQLIFGRGDNEDPLIRSLTVIGAVTDQELAGDDLYTSHRRAVYMPFTSWERMSAEGFQFFVMSPSTPDLKDQALGEVRAVLGKRHGFEAQNTNALVPYFDAIERGKQIDGIFGGLEIFLSAVGALILLLGAVGVANVVLMSVAARTFEFGLRRALGCKRRWIFAQVFVEAALVCVLSGLLGFGLGVRRETGKMMRMKESYDEGPATHIGPESCVFTREGSRAELRPGDEALTGVRIGRVSSRERRTKPRGLTSYRARKATRTRALQASPRPPLRGLRPRACAESSCAGTGRALDWPRQIDGGVVRNGNPKGVIR